MRWLGEAPLIRALSGLRTLVWVATGLVAAGIVAYNWRGDELNQAIGRNALAAYRISAIYAVVAPVTAIVLFVRLRVVASRSRAAREDAASPRGASEEENRALKEQVLALDPMA